MRKRSCELVNLGRRAKSKDGKTIKRLLQPRARFQKKKPKGEGKVIRRQRFVLKKKDHRKIK